MPDHREELEAKAPNLPPSDHHVTVGNLLVILVFCKNYNNTIKNQFIVCPVDTEGKFILKHEPGGYLVLIHRERML